MSPHARILTGIALAAERGPVSDDDVRSAWRWWLWGVDRGLEAREPAGRIGRRIASMTGRAVADVLALRPEVA